MYLWINVPDLTMLKSLGSLGNPVFLLLSEDRGDELLDGAVLHPDRFDDMYLVVKVSTLGRADILKDALELIGRRKIGRKIRTRFTKTSPRCPPWKWVAEKG